MIRLVDCRDHELACMNIAKMDEESELQRFALEKNNE
jgi:hypothetical protein